MINKIFLGMVVADAVKFCRVIHRMSCGRKRTTPGTSSTIINRTRSAIRKGAIPPKIVRRDNSGFIDFSTNTFMPIGGVISAISETIITTIPN